MKSPQLRLLLLFQERGLRGDRRSVSRFANQFCLSIKNKSLEHLSKPKLLKEFFNNDIKNFYQNQDNHNPFEARGFPIL
jgi:hypothetical protein